MRTALTMLVLLIAAAPAAADVRTATITDGVDAGATFDVARVQIATDRDAGSLAMTVEFHTAVPAAIPSGGGPHYLSFWISARDRDRCLAGNDTVGDTYVTVGTNYSAGGWKGSYNVKFRQEHTTVPLSWSDDRRTVTISFTDDLLKQSNHRCVTGGGSGQQTHDPSQPSGGSDYDSLDRVWFAGQEPPPPPPPAPTTTQPSTPGGPGAAPGAPAADGACDSPALRLTGGTKLAHGNEGPVNVRLAPDTDYEYAGGAVISMRAEPTGKDFYTYRFDEDDDARLEDDEEPLEFFIDLDPEREPATVILTWTQSEDGDGAHRCTATLRVQPILGSAARFFVRGGGTGELIPRGRRCWEVRTQRVTVTITGGGRRARFTRADACSPFKGRSKNVGRLRVSRTSHGTLQFYSYGEGRAKLTVRVGRKTVLRRTILSRERSRPDRRILEGTDGFFNYCIKGGKELFSYRLRLYCIRPGSYSSAVLFRR